MSHRPTEQFIRRLEALKAGDLSLLRTLKHRPLDFNLMGFDIFTALWWPLREASAQAPRRDVAWLITKLYAANPIPQKEDATFPILMGRLYHAASKDEVKQEQITRLFDQLLNSPLNNIEPVLYQCLSLIQSEYNILDWVALTDSLSAWEALSVRERWAKDFLNHKTTREVTHD